MKTMQIIKYFASALCLVLAVGSATVFAADEGKFAQHTSMAEILDNPDARAVMSKHVPELMANPQIEDARVISLGELAGYVPDQLNEETMTALLADLNALEE